MTDDVAVLRARIAELEAQLAERATGKTFGTLTGYETDGEPGDPFYQRPFWKLDVEPNVAIRLKRMFPRIEPWRGELSLVDTPEIARDLEWVLARYPLEMSDADREHLRRRADQHRRTERKVTNILAGGQGKFVVDHLPTLVPYPEQEQAAQLVHATGRLLLGDDVGYGKAQPVDAAVLTPSGFRAMGELAVGDELIAADGSVTRVDGVFPQGELDCYRVTFSDGSSVECNDEHLWQVRHCGGPTRSKTTGERNPVFWGVRTLRELLEMGLRTSSGQAKWHIPMAAAADLDTGLDRPLDPYLLGLLLGDGGFRGACPTFTTVDAEIREALARLLPEHVTPKKADEQNLRLTGVEPPAPCSCGRSPVARGLCGRCYQRAQKSGEPLPPKRGVRRNPLTVALKRLGLWGHTSLEKFVPDAYKLASVEVRLAVLQGLLDTDGHAMRRGGESATALFYTSSERLADDVRWLAESLGGTGRRSIKHFAGRDRYTITVKLPAPYNPFRLSRKADLWGKGHETLKPTRAIVDVEHVGRKPMQCIAVEHPSRLYITDEFVVTHNTIAALLTVARADALPAVIVVPAHLARQWHAEARRVFPTLKTHLVRTSKVYDPARRRGTGHYGHQPDVYIVTYTMLHGWVDHLAPIVKTVVFEEAQELRHQDTRKYRVCEQLARKADYRMELTATPVYNYGGEAHTVIEVIDKDVLGSRREFVTEWGDGDRGTKTKIKDPAALGRYLRDEGVYLARKRKKGPPQKIPYLVDTSERDLDRQLDAVLDLAYAVKRGEGTSAERMRNAGELDWRVRQATGIAKIPQIDAFARMLLESEDRIVLWLWHRELYDQLGDRLAEFNPVMYSGSESPAAKQRAVETFCAPLEVASGYGDETIPDPEASRVFMMSLRSGAGVDGLQHATRTGIFGELDWSPQVHDQALGRIDPTRGMDPRLDATDVGSAVGYFLHCDHGSDPVVMDVLNIKRMQSDPIHDPDAPLFELPGAAQAADDRMRKLADAVIARRARRKLASGVA